MKSLDDAPFLNFFDPAFEANPAAVVNAIRAQSCLARTPIGAMVVGHAQVEALLADPRLGSSLLPFVRLQGLPDGLIDQFLSRALLAVDGDDHTRLRKLVSRAFTPRSVEQLRPSMRALSQQLVEGFAHGGTCEFMSDFADRYPIQMICELLGVPREDHQRFGEWANGLTWVLSLEVAVRMPEIQAAFEGLAGYLEEFIEERRRAPRDDLVTRLIQAEDGGDHLSPIELRAMIGALLFAGYDTTRNQLGIAMALFAQHPQQWQLLADEPSLVGRAVEEVLRFMGTVTVAPRIAVQALEVGGYHVPAGTILTLSTGAANHDPAAHEQPLLFDITVERALPPLTFGGGPHYCLGANLARAEMQEALLVLSQRLRGLEMGGEARWRPRTGIFGPTHLPLRFRPPPAQ
jgi:cytochrome P450